MFTDTHGRHASEERAFPFDGSFTQDSSENSRKDIEPIRHHASPSLSPLSPGSLPAYELKFLLEEPQAQDVIARLNGSLLPDPHGDPALDGDYRVSTLYCDTPELEVFHRLGVHQRRKYRLRRYGNEPSIYLERKSKRGERVRKQRSAVLDHEISLLGDYHSPADWEGNWFHRQLVLRRLRPTCCVAYRRRAFTLHSSDGPVRVTFDREIRGIAAADWLVPAPAGLASAGGAHPAALSNRVVCEFKFHGTLTAICRSLIHEMQLHPTGVSKYRHCLEACRLPAGGKAAHD